VDTVHRQEVRQQFRAARHAEERPGDGRQDLVAPQRPIEGGERMGHHLAQVPVGPDRHRAVVGAFTEAVDLIARRLGSDGDGAGLEPEERRACTVQRPLQVERPCEATGEAHRLGGDADGFGLVEHAA
jgi:hypothetical protein